MPSDKVISVEYRFPLAGVNTGSSRDRMQVSEAWEMVNVRPYQRLTSTTDLADAPTYGGGSRGGLALWGNTGRPEHINSFARTDGVRKIVVIDGASPAVIHYADVIISATYSTLTPSASAFPQDKQRSAEFGGKLYVVGLNNSNQPVGSVISDPLAVTPMSFPTNMFGTATALQGPTTIAFFRGSAYYANRASNQYCVSKIGEPTQFNYGANPVVTSAYLGNSSSIAGVPGENIIELVPFGNDYLVMLCESSVYQLNGDPRAGGRVTSLTQTVGIQPIQGGYLAHCTDSEGRLWFIGSGGSGLHVMAPGQPPKNVSDEKVRRWFRDSWAFSNFLSVAYDVDGDRIVMATTLPSSIFGYSVLIYDIKTGRWSSDTFPSTAGYFAFGNPDRNSGGLSKRGALFAQGNANGILHLSDSVATDRLDNGSGVISNPGFVPYIRFAPFELAGGDAESMCLDLTAQAERGCGPINWYWLTADSPADVVALSHTDAVRSGQFFPDSDVTRDRSVSVRATGGAHQLIIRGVAGQDMRLQRFVARFRSTGRRRL